MNAAVTQLYQAYLQHTGDSAAAASLTLADVMQSNADQAKTAPPDQSLTVADAAVRLRISTETIYELVARGELNHHRIGRGRSIRFRPADIQEYQRRMAEATRRPLTHQNPHRF
jgi:excisionase family DNA binding protein